MQAIILAHGNQTRLPNLRRPKQLLKIAGKTLLASQVEGLKSRGFDQIVVVAPKTGPFGHIWTAHAFHLKHRSLPQPGACVVAGLSQILALPLESRITVLLGDVYFQADFWQQIPSNDPITFWKSPDFTMGTGETFALSANTDILRGLVDEADCLHYGPVYQGSHFRQILRVARLYPGLREVVLSDTFDIDDPGDVIKLGAYEDPDNV